MSQPTDAAQSQLATVAIVGVGLIGGSIAAALKEKGLARTVIGVGRNAARLAQALARGLLDETATDLAQAAARAELLVVCTPVDRIAQDVARAAGACRPGTIITDAGSTKRKICEALAVKLPAGVEFIGSHPLAGSETQGFEHADTALFEGRVCVVTPVPENSRSQIDRVVAFWKGLGSTVIEMTPAAHDAAVAQSSHLPHVVAAALALTLSPENRTLAASGFRDTTRIAASDPDLWTAILQSNAQPVLDSLQKCEETLARFRRALSGGDMEQIRALLLAAKSSRDALVKEHR